VITTKVAGTSVRNEYARSHIVPKKS
jgi:hypothetical protein